MHTSSVQARARVRADRDARTPRGSAPTAGGRGAPCRPSGRPGPGRRLPARPRGRPGRPTAGPRSQPDPGQPPGLGPAQQVGRRPVVGRAHGQQDVAGPGQQPHRRHHVRPSTLTAGSARLPTMTGWTNSTATWRPCAGHSGRHAPHRGAGREAPGQRQGGAARSSGRPSPVRRAVAIHGRHHAPAPPIASSRPWRPGRGPGRRRWAAPPVGETRNPRPASSARARPTRRTFWKTPPLSATVEPGSRRRRSAVSAISRATATWKPAATGPTPQPVGAGRRSWPAARGRVDLVAVPPTSKR
jgi:hypothetical protein